MAFFMQMRRMRQRVEEQLKDLKDEEKCHMANSPRLSGSTEQDRHNSTGIEEKDEDESETDTRNRGGYTNLDGITLKTNDNGEEYFLVEFESPEDPQNPHNWTKWIRIRSTLVIDAVAFVCTAASAIDSAVLMPASAEFHVSEVAESLATANYLIGFGIGALLASPLSELVGRYPVYLGALIVFGIWLMGAGLAPNFAAQIVFRFLAGLFSSAPLTLAGGSVSDMWNPKEKTWAFPMFALFGFGGPLLGTVIGAYIGYSPHIDWRWSEWIMLIIDGLVIFLVLVWKQETLAPQLLSYKARYFRKITGDDRFKSPVESAGESLGNVLKKNFTRPFILSAEPIVLAFTLYLSIVYIVLFTFLDGFDYIFAEVYGINEGLTYTLFVAIFIGIVSALVLVPVVYRITTKQLDRDGDSGQGEKLNQESRLWFAMIGGPFLPIGLFWMAWTDYVSISIWSPIVSCLPIGFAIVSVFMSAYMYIIDSYETYAASALTMVALVRYIAAGGMTVVGIPFYKNLGTHYTLTILACISAAAVPIPFLLYKWGPNVRSRSKYAVSPGS